MVSEYESTYLSTQARNGRRREWLARRALYPAGRYSPKNPENPGSNCHSTMTPDRAPDQDEKPRTKLAPLASLLTFAIALVLFLVILRDIRGASDVRSLGRVPTANNI